MHQRSLCVSVHFVPVREAGTSSARQHERRVGKQGGNARAAEPRGKLFSRLWFYIQGIRLENGFPTWKLKMSTKCHKSDGRESAWTKMTFLSITISQLTSLGCLVKMDFGLFSLSLCSLL